MKADHFCGNIYIFLPCYLPDADQSVLLQEKCVAGKYERAKRFMQEMDSRLQSEISKQMRQELSRVCLGSLAFACYDPEESSSSEQTIREALVFVALHKHTGLAVVTIAFNEVKFPATQLLDQVSKEDILYLPSGSSEPQPHNFEKLLGDVYGLVKAGTSRVCLSATVANKPDEAIASYYFAGETYFSENMGAKITAKEFFEQSCDNVAQYDSSELYVGKNNVLRIDTRKNNAGNVPTVYSDAAFLFIVELILFQDAAISRTNNRVLQKIGNNDFVPMRFLEDCSNEFGRTMPFWNIRVFRFVTAQNLADVIAERFETRKDLAAYMENQKFLEHKINIKYALAAEAENRVLNMIAILVFIFELVPAIYSLALMAISGGFLEMDQLIAGLSSSGVVAIILIILIKFLKYRNVKSNMNL